MGRGRFLTERPVAHRGYHDIAAGRIENTLSAAAAAVDRGFAVECDLQLTADGEAVVFHDDTLDRLTDATGPLRARTLSEIRAAAIAGTDDRIPTLGELLAAIGGRVPLVIELKPQGGGDALERRTAGVLEDYSGPIAVMSFDPGSVRAMRRHRPASAARHGGRPVRRCGQPHRCRRLRRLALRHLALRRWCDRTSSPTTSMHSPPMPRSCCVASACRS